MSDGGEVFTRFRPELDENLFGIPVETLNAWHHNLLDRLMSIEKEIAGRRVGFMTWSTGSPGYRGPNGSDDLLLRKKLLHLVVDRSPRLPEKLVEELMAVVIHHAHVVR